MSGERKVSGFERVFLAAEQVAPPFVNQMVIEGAGALTTDDLSSIAEGLARAVPASTARLRGRLSQSVWVATGKAPVIRRVTTSWDGHSDADFLRGALPPRSGPVVEILVLDREPPTVLIRTAHSLTDGQGTLLMARAIFALIRGENPELVPHTSLNDSGLARALGMQSAKEPPSDCIAPTGAADPSAPWAIRWHRTRLERSAPDKVLGRVAVAVAKECRRHGSGTIRIDVPVDLRPRKPGLRSAANLTGIARLPMNGVLGAVDSVASFTSDLRASIARGEEAQQIRLLEFVKHLPVGTMARVGRRRAKRHLRAGRYAASAVVSNLGRMNLAEFSGGGFLAERVFFIPPGRPGLPLFISVTGYDGGVELVGSMPEPLASGARLERLLDSIAAELQSV